VNPLVDHELANVMQAIKAGVLTTTTKAELEKLEGERQRLMESLNGSEAKRLKKIAAFLPNAEARYRQLVANWERLPQRYVAEARQELAPCWAARFG
jgi:flagellar motility protein MotE (MotC chaperone)